MKHECKTMKEVSANIKEFNDDIKTFVDDTIHLSMRIQDADGEPGGMTFDWLFYKQRGETRGENMFYRGNGMRWFYCPFCGKKIDKDK